MVDGLNQTVISCSFDGKIKVNIATSLFLLLLLTCFDYSSGTLYQGYSLMNLIGIP